MPNTQTDVAELQGPELDAWYRRRAEQVDAERGGAARQASTPAAARYGQLSAPPAVNIEDLRRQQEAFAAERERLATRGAAWALPALAPVAVALGLEAAAALTLPRVAGTRAPFVLPKAEPWPKVGSPLGQGAKSSLRKDARAIIDKTNGTPTSRFGADVHHSDPLEWAHLKPNAPPNRLANLKVLDKDAHNIATQAWAEFKRSLGGREPAPVEAMRAKLRIDKMVDAYVRRNGVSRPGPRPAGGGSK